ncbi:MAG: molecular chaperone TorD family protein [Candidatus Rokubacteria bacterium]|nr:molecular chaperone TorD family protein [Candidatus Rokubacteria bacterium]
MTPARPRTASSSALVDDRAQAARALVRSRVYRVAALAFRYPDGASVPVLLRLSDPIDVAGCIPMPLAEALGALHAALAGTTLEDLRADHAATFGHVTLPDCPLYETVGDSAGAFRQSQALADLAGFYRAFGLDLAEDAGERADHVSVELEFMHYLTYREAYARERHGPDAVAMLRDAQARFLAEHLAAWGPALARAIGRRTDGPLAAGAAVLERCLAAERAELGLTDSEDPGDEP